MNVPFSIIKEQFSHAFSQIYYVFSEQELQQGDIIVTNYDTSLVQKKLLLFPEMQVMKKIFTRAVANYFFNQFNWIILTERLPLWI